LIIVTDPYIRLFYQARNLMELVETIVKLKPLEEEIVLRLFTTLDEFKGEQQIEYLENIKATCITVGINFSWEFDGSAIIHARHIITDTGWKILLDRGLDIFQHYDMQDAFSLTNRLQQFRGCKAFEVTFLRTDSNNRLGE